MFLEFIARLEDIINAIINSPFKGILLSVITIVALLIVKAISGYFVKRYVYQNAQLETNAQNFMAVWGYIWTAIIAIFGIISLSGSSQRRWVSLLGFSVWSWGGPCKPQ